MQDRVHQLVEALASTEHFVRIGAAQRLREQAAHSPHAHTLATLVALAALEDARPNALAQGARLASALHLTSAAPRLRALCASKSAAVRVRKAAAAALGHLADPLALEALEVLRHHNAPMVRRVAVEAIGRLELPACFEPLADALTDPAWQVRLDAAVGLGAMCKPQAQGAFEVMLGVVEDEPHSPCAERMLRAMTELACCDEGLRKQAIALLQRHLVKWEVIPTARAAARGLGELRAQEAAGVLREALDNAPSSVAEQAWWSLRTIK